MQYDAAHALARAIRESEEYRTYHELKERVMENETNAALIREYRKLQISLQMAAASGQTPDAEDVQRFQGINTVLFAQSEVSQFLLAEMRMYQAVGDIMRIISEAADLDMGIPQS